jgi:2-(1,2-epoxy-1,2-dihydrophenyl)acetyl-CoA isomerase
VKHVIVERENGLVTLTLNRPERKNAIDGLGWLELDDALRGIEANPGDRALLITGAGGNLGAGP